MRRNNVWSAIKRERAAQDQQWGGPDHDDQHTSTEWLVFRAGFEVRADTFQTYPEQRGALIKIAALAVAQVESIDRKRREKYEVQKRCSHCERKGFGYLRFCPCCDMKICASCRAFSGPNICGIKGMLDRDDLERVRQGETQAQRQARWKAAKTMRRLEAVA